MSTFQERFAKAFDAERARRIGAGEDQLTKTMVWKAAKASSGAFTQWYDGTTSATLDRCFLMAPILRVNPHWLFDESAPMTGGLLPLPDTQSGFEGAQSPSEIQGDSAVILNFKAAPKSAENYTIRQFATGGAMGPGLTLPDQPGVIENWSVSREWLSKNIKAHSGVQNLCIVTGFGPSMQPMFNPGDPLLVDAGVKSVIADGIYFFRVGSEGFVKQLQKIPTAAGLKYVAKSKNPDYDNFEITPDMDFEVLGKVVRVWCGTDF